jgi:hydrogenase-1 operon protein HyaF
MTDFMESEILSAISEGKLTTSPQVLALLQELQNMLTTLAEHGEENRIDLRSLPMTPDDHEFMVQFLGEGEVSARVNSLGLSEIKETRFPGIWSVIHYNNQDEIVAELIEVTLLPDILKTQAEDLLEGINALHRYTQQLNN